MAEEVKKEEKEVFGFGRSNLYAQYVASQEKVEPIPEEKKEEAKPESKAEVKSAPAPEVAVPEVKPPEPEKKDEPEKKMVPLDALHQEREKRKSAQKRINDLESHLQVVLTDIKKREEKKDEKPEEISDYEKAIRDLRDQVQGLKGELVNYKTMGEQEKQKIKEKEVATLIDQTDRELDSEGFPMFKKFQYTISEEIMKRVSDEPDPQEKRSLMQELDTPQGWKKIYKETVWPDLEQHIEKKKKTETKQDKIELKKQAQLGGGSNAKAEEKPEEKNEWTYDDYLAERRKSGLGANTRRL